MKKQVSGMKSPNGWIASADRAEIAIKTSYNNNIRGTYAGIGYEYNEAEDIFITPQPYPSWVRSGSFWNAPIPMPTDGGMYSWSESEQLWQEITTE